MTDTAPPTLPSPRWRWLTIPLVGAALVFLLGLPLLAVLPSSLRADQLNRRLDEVQPAPFARIPGSAQPVDDLVSFNDISGHATQYPPAGEVYFVTVSEPKQSLLTWYLAEHDPAVTWMTREDKYGFQSPEQNRSAALQQMRTSQQVAQYVAFKKVGLDAELVKGEVVVQDLVCLVASADGNECDRWSPSDEVLDPGDKILSVEGAALTNVDDLSEALQGHAPGDVVPMRIDRPGTGELDVEVELTASPEEPERTIVGFYPFDTATVELPFEVEIDTKGVGGPSAGLAFTLTLIDELTDGELTGGVSVAVTGTIDVNGNVGPIGGLQQKASAVEQAGVDVFLVPTSQGEANVAAARQAAPDLEIIPVATLDEALAALARLGGDPLPAELG